MNDRSCVPEQSPVAATIIGDKPPEQVGSVIGAYKLLQQIGEGGFGVVYMAEQEKPVRRTVALKIIKPGMDTAQVIARFESERQALALMDHPSIARVLDAGATSSGHPYFVMELVRGVPITEYCDKNHLTPAARLKLFVDVCHAIQHAHHKGIIHRDIKPSNVMVTLHDKIPVVKVIDFGVAKATLQKLTERTLFTAYGQMLGTPAYMSPEQAEMSGLDIDTRSDVYSLGVLLYELLTGTTPLEDRRLREAGYAEMQRLIREEEPPRPSTRLSSLGDSATVAAGNRGLDVRRLVQVLGGDLDWLVMKSLEKERDRRYETPGSFAEDIERYLRHEAIFARPPSTAYRLRKFVQRYRGAVLTAATVVVALFAGTAAATWQALRATRAESAALAAADAEKQAKEDALAREAETKAVLGFVEDRIFAAARPAGQDGGLGRAVSLRKAIESALAYVDQSFPNQPLIEARLRLTLGRSFFLLGDPQTALEQEEAARSLYTRFRGSDHPDTWQSMNNLASTYNSLGRRAEALKLSEETLARRRAALGPDHPDTLTSMNNLANCYDGLGRKTEALKLRQETLELRKARLGPDHPDTLKGMRNLALSYESLGRHAEAVKLFEKTLELQTSKLGPDHPDTLRTRMSLAAAYYFVGRRAEALNFNEATLALQKAKLGLDHPDTLRTMNDLATIYETLGRQGDALKLYETTLSLQKARLGSDHPDTLLTMCGVASCLVAVQRGAEAVSVIDECVRRAAGKVVDPQIFPVMIDLRLRHFAKTGDAANCRETTVMWEKLKRTDPASLYKSACFHAVTAKLLSAAGKSTSDTDQSAVEADSAMERLKQAVAAGYKDAAQFNKNSDLDYLRNREDFNELAASLRPPKETK
jgi:serine/threonine protein kinase